MADSMQVASQQLNNTQASLQLSTAPSLEGSNCQLGYRASNCTSKLTWTLTSQTQLACLWVVSGGTATKVSCRTGNSSIDITWINETGWQFELRAGDTATGSLLASKFIKGEAAVIVGNSCQLKTTDTVCDTDVSWNIVPNSSACLFVVSGGKSTLVSCGASGTRQYINWISENGSYFELRKTSDPTTTLLAKHFVKGMRINFNDPVRGSVGSSLPPKVLPVPFTGLATSWDGRLIFNAEAVVELTVSGVKPVYYGTSVRTFRPEVVKSNSTQGLEFPNTSPNLAFSGLKMLECDWSYVNSSSSTRSYVFGSASLCPSVNTDLIDGRLHVAVAPDFRPSDETLRGGNPFPSNAQGGLDLGSTGFETYKLALISSPNSVGVNPKETAGVDSSFLVMSFAKVVVANPRSANASVQSTFVEGPGQLLRVKNDLLGYPKGPGVYPDGSPFYGYEPTVSLDGRLIIFQGRNFPKKLMHGILYYTFNENPSDPANWSQPRSVSEMYWTHGPGNTTQGEKIIAGVPFSKRYPLAAKPLVDDSGKIFVKGSFLVGAYPWLSFDASELFSPTVNSFYGPARQAYSVIGRQTNWRMRNIDGAMNTSRAALPMPKTSTDFWTNQKVTASAYDTLFKSLYGSAVPAGSWETILLAPLGLTSSMWQPRQSQWGVGSAPAGARYDLPYPMAGDKKVYSILTSHSRRYVEVPLDEFEDGQYIVKFHMNEAVAYDHNLIKTYGEGDSSVLGSVRSNGTRFDVFRTSDVSGNGVQATLRGGAQFPFEHYRALDKWLSTNGEPTPAYTTVKDIFEGMNGNSIYFPATGSVLTDPIPTLLQRIKTSQKYSLSFWVKSTQAACDGELLSVEGLITVSCAGGQLGVKVILSGVAKSLALPAQTTIPSNVWSHVGITSQFGSLKVYMDGLLKGVVQTGAGVLLSTDNPDARIKMGPGSRSQSISTTTSLDKILQMDEVAVSDIVRNDDEMLDAAFRRKSAPPAANLGPVALPSVYSASAAQVPSESSLTSATIALGKQLFFSTALSKSGQLSCATCHDPTLAFTKNVAKAVGVKSRTGLRNTPAVFNRLFSKVQNWDGGAFSLESQILTPIQHPMEMDTTIDEVIANLNSSTWSSLFQSAYGVNAATPDTIAKAMASYMRSIVSSQSTSENTATLSEAQLKGRALFFGKARCSGCHAGPNLTDEAFHNLGFAPIDSGRWGVTTRSSDFGKFKTPSLRNINRTAPYFHDGRFSNLNDVVLFYNRGGDTEDKRDFNVHPLGLSSAEMADLVSFLQSIDGTLTP
jgi:cytochrome c peroxidase